MPIMGPLNIDEGGVLTATLLNQQKEIVTPPNTSLDIPTDDDLPPPPYQEGGYLGIIEEPERVSYVNKTGGLWTEKQSCVIRFFSTLLICAEIAWPIILYYLNTHKLLPALYYEDVCVVIHIYRAAYGSSGKTVLQHMDCYVIDVLEVCIFCCGIIDIILYTKYPDLLKYKGYVTKIPYILKKIKIILLSVPITYIALFISGERYFPILLVTCLWMVTINIIPIMLYIITKMPSGVYKRNKLAQVGIILQGFLHAGVIIFMAILNYQYEYVDSVHGVMCILRLLLGIVFPLGFIGVFSICSTSSYATLHQKDPRNNHNGCSFLSLEILIFICIVVQTHLSALYFD